MSLDVEIVEVGDSRIALADLVTSTDSSYLTEIAQRGSAAWAGLKAITVAACFRQKQLFEQLETRQAAAEATGHTSWSAWLSALDLPVSDGWVRQRCLEIDGYLQQGADWGTVLNIVAFGPTAGADVLQNVLDTNGNPLPHIDVEQLPEGSVAGLLRAVAAIPDPGQARRLVSEMAGEVQIYAKDAVYDGSRLYLTMVYERPSMDDTLYVTVLARSESGHNVEVPEAVARWLVRRLGARMV